MSDQPPQPPSRFTPQNKTTHERLSTNTVGLVALSDFRKRRAEVLEQQEREAREAALASARTATATATSTPDRSQTATPTNNASDKDKDKDNNSEGEGPRKKKKTTAKRKALVSFGDDDEEEEGGSDSAVVSKVGRKKKEEDGKAKDLSGRDASEDASDAAAGTGTESASGDDKGKPALGKKVAVNASVGIVPRALTKAALRREAAEREALRKEFLLLQAAVKATEIAIPFVFYDGTNIPGGTVRVKKGDFVWLFLDKSRKVGAQLGVGADKSSNVRRDWARVSVDDLMLVRGSMIIPHVSLCPSFGCTQDT